MREFIYKKIRISNIKWKKEESRMKINTLYPVPYTHFEGIDASGKTTQLCLAEKYFIGKGYEVTATRQPGGTLIGQKLRGILLDPENVEMDPWAEVLLYMSDRIQHMKERIIPDLHRKPINLSKLRLFFQDRGQVATEAYQGGGRELDINLLRYLHENIVIQKYQPDSILFFDIGIEESQRRLKERNKGQQVENDRLEEEGCKFFTRVREGYYESKKRNPDLITIINAERSIDEIHKDVVAHIEELIEAKNKIFQYK